MGLGPAASPSTDLGALRSLDTRQAPFALLDASREAGDGGWSRLMTEPVEELACTGPHDAADWFARIEAHLTQGRHVLVLADYALGYALQPRLSGLLRPGTLARAVIFGRCDRLLGADVDSWLSRLPSPGPSGIAGLQPGIAEDAYLRAVQRILDYIREGDCYQVNFTFPMRFDWYGAPLALYRAVRERQRVGYGAFVALGDRHILSFSPELFVRRDGATLTAKPMKGTLRRGSDQLEDVFLRESLAEDEKNRAENVMIVDLLRNDLGRLATTGSVRVEKLFEVESYRTLLQMTSTIRAELRPGVGLADVFAALFPCGSITGAPKIRCMEIIAEQETASRGLYTGAIGYLEPSGDFCFNVPIRTLELKPDGRGSFGIGSGIVHDSRPRDEYAECLLKAHFVTGLDPGFRLIETLRCEAGSLARLPAHLARLEASARYFGFVFDAAEIGATLARHAQGLTPGLAHRTRLTLAKDGQLHIESFPLEPASETSVELLLSPERIESDHLFLRHKTTVRALYDRELKRATGLGAFDALFLNQRGELAEGARSSVFVKLGGRWYTPPLACGVLPGVMRAALLADPAFGAAERVLTLADVRASEAIAVTNSVRGWLPARLLAKEA